MEGFYLYLLLLVIVIAYTIAVLFVYRKFLIPLREPDAILSFTENEENVKGNFLVLLPMDKLRSKDYIIVEIQNQVEEPSQEKQEL